VHRAPISVGSIFSICNGLGWTKSVKIGGLGYFWSKKWTHETMVISSKYFAITPISLLAALRNKSSLPIWKWTRDGTEGRISGIRIHLLSANSSVSEKSSQRNGLSAKRLVNLYLAQSLNSWTYRVTTAKVDRSRWRSCINDNSSVDNLKLFDVKV